MNKRNNMLNHIARLLIIISIVTFSFGLILDIRDNNKIIDPVRDVVKKNKEKNIVSITPADTNKVVSITDINSRGVSNDAVGGETPSDINLALKEEIQKEFSIQIKYGDETVGYNVGGLSTFPLTNENVINIQLKKLQDTLKLYPVGFFKEVYDGGIPLTIYLIEKFSDDNITGITDSSYSYANISIASVFPFEESFFHESYHYIERFLFKKGVNYNSWDSLNPVNFSYGDIIFSEYSYADTFSQQAFFVNNYAQTAAAEDRASTFEYMMAKEKVDCLNDGNTIWQKAKLMANTIDVVFDTVSPDTTEYWERYL